MASTRKTIQLEIPGPENGLEVNINGVAPRRKTPVQVEVGSEHCEDTRCGSRPLKVPKPFKPRQLFFQGAVACPSAQRSCFYLCLLLHGLGIRADSPEAPDRAPTRDRVLALPTHQLLSTTRRPACWTC